MITKSILTCTHPSIQPATVPLFWVLIELMVDLLLHAAWPPLPLPGAGVAVVGIGYQSHQSQRSPLVPTHLSAPWAPAAAPATTPATIPTVFRGLLPVQIVGKQPAHRPWSSRSDHYPLTHPPVPIATRSFASPGHSSPTDAPTTLSGAIDHSHRGKTTHQSSPALLFQSLPAHPLVRLPPPPSSLSTLRDGHQLQFQ